VGRYSLKQEITNDDWETACKAMLELPLPQPSPTSQTITANPLEAGGHRRYRNECGFDANN
jgi:hypothetical protein